MKVVTFNIRGDFGVDGANDFCHRKPLILKKLAEEQPDIIGFREVLPHVAAWMREALPAYDIVGCGREAALTGEQMTVAFRRDRFRLIEMKTFWLSPTPYVPGSRFQEQSWCPRTATELLLQHNDSGKVLRVVNTHLDHEGSEARRLGLAMLLGHLDQSELLRDAPIILMGDFNAEPGSPELEAFAQHPEYSNATAAVGTTFHGFMHAEPVQIDYIFLKGVTKASAPTKWTDAENGVYLSDHYPVAIELELE